MVRRRWWVVAVLVVLGVAAAWYLGSPLFINRTIVEPFTGTVDAARGTFTDADGFHKGSGLARVVREASGHVVRLEEFRVTNGPDLYVYLAAHRAPRSRAQVEEGFGHDFSQYHSVVIYCRAFHVVFSTATLAAP